MWTSVPTLCFRLWPVCRGNAPLRMVARRFSDSSAWTRFSILRCGCVARFSDFETEIWGQCITTRFGGTESRCGLRNLEMHCRAVDGAILMPLRLATAGGPLQARPLLQSLSALVTMGLISLSVNNLEIGKCSGSDSPCVHLPPANAGQAESVGGETVNDEGEFCMHEKGSDMEDKEGKRTTPCAVPIPIMAL